MGWSCSSKASNRMQAITDWIIANGGEGSQNTWRDPKTGQRYFLEISRRENVGGAITGSINRFTDGNYCVKSGSFRIDGDGKGFRGPALLKAIEAYEVIIDGQWPSAWPIKFGKPDDTTLWEYLKHVAKGYEIGGINAHVSKAMGYIPYPNTAKVVRLNDGATVVEWKAAMFQVWSA